MKKEAKFLAPESIAERAGVKEVRFRTAEGKYILSEHDMRQVRFTMTPDDFVNGLPVEKLSEEQAEALIRKKSTTLGGGVPKNNNETTE